MKYKCIKYLTDWHTLSPTKDDHMSVATSIDGLRLVLDSTDKIKPRLIAEGIYSSEY